MHQEYIDEKCTIGKLEVSRRNSERRGSNRTFAEEEVTEDRTSGQKLAKCLHSLVRIRQAVSRKLNPR